MVCVIYQRHTEAHCLLYNMPVSKTEDDIKDDALYEARSSLPYTVYSLLNASTHAVVDEVNRIA
jgi:hypothetical protein